MHRYIIQRVLQLIPILFGITFLTFSLMQFTQDDAVDHLYEQSGAAISEEVKDQKRAELGLDQPFLVQYGHWLKGAATGNMGRSYISGKRVFESFSEKLPMTVELMLVSIAMTLLISIPFGILALKLNLFPIMGSRENAASVFLPALTLAISMSAKYTRQIRAAVLEELGKPYVAGARSRGISEWTILTHSVLRSSFITIITLLALSIGSLLGGTAIVETIFIWDGVGKLVVDAILSRDYPLIQAYVVWMSIIYVGVNLAADLLYHALDPRVRHEEEMK